MRDSGTVVNITMGPFGHGYACGAITILVTQTPATMDAEFRNA